MPRKTKRHCRKFVYRVCPACNQKVRVYEDGRVQNHNWLYKETCPVKYWHLTDELHKLGVTTKRYKLVDKTILDYLPDRFAQNMARAIDEDKLALVLVIKSEDIAKLTQNDPVEIFGDHSEYIALIPEALINQFYGEKGAK